MNLCVLGSGDVGAFICEPFSVVHDITVIKQNPAVARNVNNTYNVRVILRSWVFGKGTTRGRRCDYFIAMTSDDQSNILACSIAKALGPKMRKVQKR